MINTRTVLGQNTLNSTCTIFIEIEFQHNGNRAYYSICKLNQYVFIKFAIATRDYLFFMIPMGSVELCLYFFSLAPLWIPTVVSSVIVELILYIIEFINPIEVFFATIEIFHSLIMDEGKTVKAPHIAYIGTCDF